MQFWKIDVGMLPFSLLSWAKESVREGFPIQSGDSRCSFKHHLLLARRSTSTLVRFAMESGIVPVMVFAAGADECLSLCPAYLQTGESGESRLVGNWYGSLDTETFRAQVMLKAGRWQTSCIS